MLPKLEFDEERVHKDYLGTDEEFEQFKELLDTHEEFKKFDAYTNWANGLLYCFKGYEDWNQPMIVDYGYGLTCAAVEKYILDTYGDSNPDKFMVEIGLMSFDYEKPWKFGTYVDLDGNQTDHDFEEYPEIVQGNYGTEEDAEVEGHFIRYSIYDITHKR